MTRTVHGPDRRRRPLAIGTSRWAAIGAGIWAEVRGGVRAGAAAAIAMCMLSGSHALADPPPSYGLDFVTVGAPGNRATLPFEVPMEPWRSVGAVGYEYRIMRTEVTTADWLPFVRAYAPYWGGSFHDPRFVGEYIGFDGTEFHAAPGTERWPTEMSWRVAAVYCNWLHNGRGSGPEAFASGAYDTSTFGTDPMGYPVEQAARSPGAKFWIPSWDEWAKAAFYDPDRYGPGIEGYWLWPNGGDEFMVSALPELGGQTNAFLGVPSAIWQMDVGSYPWSVSPWGLLDVSGGEREWSETYLWTGERLVLGSRIRDTLLMERVDGIVLYASGSFFRNGLRVASAVPSPGCIGLLAAAFCLTGRRRHE